LIPDLLPLLEVEDAEVCGVAIHALGALVGVLYATDKVMMDAVTDAILDQIAPGRRCRIVATRILGAIGCEFASMKDPRGTSVIQALLRGVDDADTAMSLAAAGAILDMDVQDVPTLTRLLRVVDPDIQERAIFALGDMGSAAETAVPVLDELRKGSGGNVRDAASEAIQKIRAGSGRRP
jgi:hypothetical protein